MSRKAFNVEDVVAMMKQRTNIRNLSVIAHVDHGKSTLTDSLIAMAGLMRAEDAGKKRTTDTRPDEAARAITIKSTGVTLHMVMPDEIKLPQKVIDDSGDNREFLVNLIDSPGHVDFSSEVTAALRVTDGAMVVVDSVSGVSVQTETVLQQALAELSKPALCINKIDRMFFEVKYGPEEQYQQYRKIIENINAIISTVRDEDEKSPTTWLLHPTRNCQVVFGSGYYGWAFTLATFSRQYAKLMGVDEEKFRKRLWGDNFFDHETKKWRKEPVSADGKRPLKRAFCEFIIEPLQKVIDFTLEFREKPGRWKKQVLERYNVKVSQAEIDANDNPKEMTRLVLLRWLPAGPALRDAIIMSLPSPVMAQQYRYRHLYSGNPNDETARSIRECDPEGPLVLYISKMIPDDDKGTRFYCFGRVFSGTVTTNQKVYIPKRGQVSAWSEEAEAEALEAQQAAASSSSSEKSDKRVIVMTKKSAYEVPVRAVHIMMCANFEKVAGIPAGNTVAISGLDKYITKTGTVLSSKYSYPLHDMNYSVSAVVRCAVEAGSTAELQKFQEALRRLALTDNIVTINFDDQTGQCIIGAAGELHMEIVLNDLQGMMTNCKPLKIGEPVVSYRETISASTEGTQCMTKSANKHNRLYFQAEPMPEEWLEEEGQWRNEAPLVIKKGLWSFAPDQNGPNMLVNSTTGISGMDEIRDSCHSAFQWVASEGGLCEEPMRGCRFDIIDATLHSDSIHRGGGQILPQTRRAILGCQLSAQPRLLEPIFLVEVNVPQMIAGQVHSVLSSNRGTILGEEPVPGTALSVVKAHLPVANSFGITSKLRSATSGRAFMQMTFDHWSMVPGDPYDPKSLCAQVVAEIRKRKGLKPEIPTALDYLDKL